MILEEETFRQFGYWPNELAPHSGKKILIACDDCGKVREGTKNHYHPLCVSCAKKKEHLSEENLAKRRIGLSRALKGRHITEEQKQKLREANLGKHHSEETKKKISEALKSGKAPWLGKHLPADLCRRMSESRKGENNPNYGKHFSEEHKKKIGKANKGSRNGLYRAGKNHPMFGKHHTAEARRKMSIAKTGLLVKEKHPNWQGGKSFEPYCPKFDNNLKERVREFFGRKCYLCGKTEGENGRKLSVHHVNYDKMVCCNDTPPLFVPLCIKHHNMTNRNREDWNEFFELSLGYLTGGKCFYTEEEYKALKDGYGLSDIPA